MPRIMAPPPSGEFNVTLVKPFSGKPTSTIQITGEPNRVSTILTKNNTGGSEIQKTGEMSADDTQELLRLVDQLRGFPSDASKDVYGLDAKLEFQTFEISWTNGEDDSVASTVEAETKTTFKEVVDSIEAAARQFAKQDNAI